MLATFPVVRHGVLKVTLDRFLYVMLADQMLREIYTVTEFSAYCTLLEQGYSECRSTKLENKT